jgi:hypothetical protein
MAGRGWAACACFEQRHIFLGSLSSGAARQEATYVDYTTDGQFLAEHGARLGPEATRLLGEVREEVGRRQARFGVMAENRKSIEESYTPRHPHLFDESRLPDVKEVGDLTRISEDIVSFPLLGPALCDALVEELDRFKASGLKHSRPNSMNRQGVILEEVGLGKVVEAVRVAVEPLARRLFPALLGETGLDSCRAFTVDYDASEDEADKELSTHFDNSEVTVNVSLTAGHKEGELYFLQGEQAGRAYRPVQHRKGWGVLHRGAALHGALPVTDGSRSNLILWFRWPPPHCPH